MNRALALVAAAPLLLTAADSTVPLTLRRKPVPMTRLEGGTGSGAGLVMFVPGDGGWRGTAVSMGRMISSWGYEVYGFDTKRYLETFSEGGRGLSQQEMAADLVAAAGVVAGPTHRRVILVGWSQGACMAIAASAGRREPRPIQGVVALGLPESGVLGWDWRATLAVLAHRPPDQPAFWVKPLLAEEARPPLWMIHGSEDEYTPLEVARGLYRAAVEPKRMEEIPGANHSFEGRRDELWGSLRRGLAWIGSY